MKKKKHNLKLNLQKTARPTISLCMIVRNEEKYLGQCLESVKDLVDEIIIVDTGSTDRTLEIAQKYQAAIAHYSWNDDFAAARNESLKPAISDWILALDADEEIDPENRTKIRKLLEAPQSIAFYLNLRSPIPENANGKVFVNAFPRLFKNRLGIIYGSPIHEHIMFSLERLGVVPLMTDVTVNHFGYSSEKEDKNEKLARNLRILMKQIEKDPASGTAWFHLGETRALIKDFNGAISAFEQALQTGNLPKYLVSITHQSLATTWLNLQKFPEARQASQQAMEKQPELLVPRFVLAFSAYLEHDFTKAAKNFQNYLAAARKMKHRSDRLFEHEPNYGVIYTCLGDCYRNLNQPEEAEKYYRKAIDEGSQRSGTFLGLARVLHAAQKPVAAIEILEEARTRKIENPQIGEMLARTCFLYGLELIKQNHFAEAEKVLLKAQTISPATPEIYYNLAVISIKRREYKTAIQNFEAALKLKPGDSLIQKNLELIPAKTGINAQEVI